MELVCKHVDLLDACMTVSDRNGKKAKGGLARAEALAPETRHAIAKKAAVARWGVKPALATHRGNLKEAFGLDVECYLLGDGKKTAAVNKMDVEIWLGLHQSGRPAADQAVAANAPLALLSALANPLLFYMVGSRTPERESPATVQVVGLDASVLAAASRAILDVHARGILPADAQRADQARSLLNSIEQTSVEGVICKVTGYNPERAAINSAFVREIKDEVRELESEFPPQLYEGWYSLYELQQSGQVLAEQIRWITLHHVYYPLAKANQKVPELLAVNRAEGRDRTKGMHQFLSAIGRRALGIHLGRVLEMVESSKSIQEYEQKIVDRFGQGLERDSM